MRTVIFDLDGTLADTSADMIAAANACFRARGLGAPLEEGADAWLAFHGGKAMLRAGYERLALDDVEARVDADFDPLLAAYEAGIARQTRLYPGVEGALMALAQAGFALGVCTNKPERLAEALLAALGIRSAFGAMIGPDTLSERKPHPLPYREAVRRAGGDPARSFLVGDTETDRQTAAAAGVPCVLVSFGPEGQGISRLAPAALLDHFDDLPALAERLLPR